MPCCDLESIELLNICFVDLDQKRGLLDPTPLDSIIIAQSHSRLN